MTAPSATTARIHLYGPEIQRLIFSSVNQTPNPRKGGIGTIGEAVQFLLNHSKNPQSVQIHATEVKAEYWHDQAILASYSIDNAAASGGSNSGESDAETQIFVDCAPESIEKSGSTNERVLMLHNCDLNKYGKVFTEKTTLVTDDQSLAHAGVQIPPDTFDFERQVNACIQGMRLLPKNHPLLQLQAITVLLSTACALILERMPAKTPDEVTWQGIFVYLPNLYDSAKPAFALCQKSPRYYEAFTALFLAKWLGNDTEDRFNLRNKARYRLSLAVHDALMLNSMLLDPTDHNKNFCNCIQKQPNPKQTPLETFDSCSDAGLNTLLMRIRRTRGTWQHPLHVPVDDIRMITHRPWALLPALQLDGFTLARAIWSTPEVKGIPTLCRGNMCTFDTVEIVGAMRMEQHITKYRDNEEKGLLNIAIFGPPGAGKSFFVEQIIEGINAKKREGQRKIELVTFNLSQVDFSQANSAIINVFHIIRDISLRGKLPLLFVDEFDVEEMKWVKLFLAPMQDGKFIEGTEVHELPRCIIVFAGGVVSSLAELLDIRDGRAKKIPDFVSRLQATLCIKGINPDDVNDPDRMYIARRALILKKNFIKNFPECTIEDGLFYALLHVKSYQGGARAINKLMSSMTPPHNHYIHRNYLPADAELSQYMDVESFQQQYAFGCMLYSEAGRIAQRVYEKYCDMQKAHRDCCGVPLTYGYRESNVPCDPAKVIEGNREGTLHLPGFLRKNGYEIEIRDASNKVSCSEPILGFTDLGNSLSYYEHMRWMAMRMLNGLWFSTVKITDGGKTLTTPYFVDCATLRTLTMCNTQTDLEEHTSYTLDREIAKLHIEEIQKCFVIRKAM